MPSRLTDRVKQLPQSETDQGDVNAIVNIKLMYGVTRNWRDPCVPKAYVWDGLECSYYAYEPPRIISLVLSSSGLTGDIAPSISNLTKLEFLDLSNNSLTGPVPDFLSQLPSLKVLTGVSASWVSTTHNPQNMKSTNILLNQNFQAKLADFGLSKIDPIDDGYLDPEYFQSNTLTEKSDIYSFRIMFLR
ncbi:hypothetical protein SLA2020_447530 [Shorea laevis]